MARTGALISANQSADVNNIPVVGLIQKVVLIPIGVLPKANITKSSHLITAMTLSSTGFGFECREAEDFIGANVENRGASETIQKFGHSITGLRSLNPDVAALNQVNILLNGFARYYAIVKRKWEGTSQEDAFLFYGYDVGLKPVLNAWSTKENDGVPVFDLVTPDGEHETALPYNVLLTDYSTTNTAFEANFTP